LIVEMALMAWSHRSKAPIIVALASDTDYDGSAIRVEMIPRSFWDEDPRFLDTFTAAQREGIRMMFGESSFPSSTRYVSVLRYGNQKGTITFTTTRGFQANGPVRAVDIVEALTAATRPEDLAEAFAWFEDALQAQPAAQEILQVIRNRDTTVHGSTAPRASVLIPTRALNNEVAYMMMDALNLAFDICLTGLRSATHLNGREGVIRGRDPADIERWTARLDDGTCVSVKAANFVHVRRGDYRRVPP
jgi:hypothetical protein